MFSKNKKASSDNDWDYQSVPAIPLKKHRYSTDRAIAKLIYSKNDDDADLKLQLRRARQLAYVEPWFQEFLPEKLKGRLFIASLGRKFWLIGALDSLSGNNFKFYQKEIRQTLENYLNTISQKEWSIPEFKVQVMPKKAHDAIPEFSDKTVTTLSVRSNKSLLADKTNRSIDDILASMMDNAKKHGR
ncbi:hypothetical protein [Wohlfahrtiimonas larvae]|uniref:DUF721 domain-containing protein n=1 Tax=Wohlfahrtiimonas larvae TaxID=1157986 RepID=A0ABP9MLL3_9GAMM|nr:hypothetical protein [Wohlfahrtiimonas larvae]